MTTATHSDSDYLTREEAAALARVHPETLQRWAKRGLPVGRVRHGGRTRYVRDRLVAFLRGEAAKEVAVK